MTKQWHNDTHLSATDTNSFNNANGNNSAFKKRYILNETELDSKLP